MPLRITPKPALRSLSPEEALLNVLSKNLGYKQFFADESATSAPVEQGDELIQLAGVYFFEGIDVQRDGAIAIQNFKNCCAAIMGWCSTNYLESQDAELSENRQTLKIIQDTVIDTWDSFLPGLAKKERFKPEEALKELLKANPFYEHFPQSGLRRVRPETARGLIPLAGKRFLEGIEKKEDIVIATENFENCCTQLYGLSGLNDVKDAEEIVSGARKAFVDEQNRVFKEWKATCAPETTGGFTYQTPQEANLELSRIRRRATWAAMALLMAALAAHYGSIDNGCCPPDFFDDTEDTSNNK